MSWKQILSFNPSKMGVRKRYCLQNTRLAFGIQNGKFASAKADWNSQVANKTAHYGGFPAGRAVAVYGNMNGRNGHVGVWHNGAFYSDGKISNMQQVFSNGGVAGWGELCDGQRVVEWVGDAPAGGFLPAKGYWTLGDNDPKIGQLAAFMRATFPSYTNAKALGNYYGGFLQSSIREFQRRTGLQQDGNTGPLTYQKLQSFGFKG